MDARHVVFGIVLGRSAAVANVRHHAHDLGSIEEVVHRVGVAEQAARQRFADHRHVVAGVPILLGEDAAAQHADSQRAEIIRRHGAPHRRALGARRRLVATVDLQSVHALRTQRDVRRMRIAHRGRKHSGYRTQSLFQLLGEGQLVGRVRILPRQSNKKP